MRRLLLEMSIIAALVIGVVGCGSASSDPASSASSGSPADAAAPVRQAHAQAVQPAAGVQAEASPAGGGAEVVGDPNAHAPPLSEVKRQLNLLNLCGGTNNSA